ncbi:tRNA uridine-5-carboxymethylaminomethyl(34) synthesis GTPase MnmE [Anaerocolumna xylanovorans]|uniref:tRNA modification GTPase MnmE n=1 Tax=Anaerocolumna xylanovorans DSM 12503 TaxID=1121345 RepID=A0A1M7YP60_9FIRM|nr:tRNA uridine-5-carboxymethylaminomethyl(34) synthesis GTPase MnmE [Anaerocolumna xylanovorans]SHO54266.1 tRNA modification GTPase trmE [Anaerocolumna xylanovorans DSM 12503]
MNTDTIAAIATAVNNSGISIIRISGPDAIMVADKVFKAKNENKKLASVPSHTIHYGYIKSHELTIDEVLVMVMKAPNSYTKEDIVEINCHGGIIVTKKVLEEVIKSGARIAEPGEFTKRAFLNGRIDLSQAEAVSDIINAKNNYALKNSLNQLKGTVYKKIKELRKNILHDLAYLEAGLDDPEHIDIGGFRNELLNNIINYKKDIKKLLDTVNNGRLIKEGIKTVILGKPNAGKSSLLNALIGAERAIVTDIPGTTRDTLEETLMIGDLCLNIVDTAGIRNTTDVVESMGVKRARLMSEESDLILYVVDASEPLDENDEEIINMIKSRNAVILLNKSDLEQVITVEEIKEKADKKVLLISAREKEGLEELEEYIKDIYFKGMLEYNDEVYITNLRQEEALRMSLESLEMVQKTIEDDMPEDLYAVDMMSSYEALGKITGEQVDEDLINTIFREFCMGK